MHEVKYTSGLIQKWVLEQSEVVLNTLNTSDAHAFRVFYYHS